MLSADDLQFDQRGLIPVIVQSIVDRRVLMLAYADIEAVQKTHKTGFAHFYSRSRQKLWKKGETSGNVLEVAEIITDCDCDAVLYIVEPQGPTCHTGEYSCFYNKLHTNAGCVNDWDTGVLKELSDVIASRRSSDQEASYTASLLQADKKDVLKKIGEEATEVIIAQPERIPEEMADLLYHCMILLAHHNKDLSEVLDVLRYRRTQK